MNADLPLILIEVVLVFGGALLFGWWQFHEIKRDRAKAAASKAAADEVARREASDEAAHMARATTASSRLPH